MLNPTRQARARKLRNILVHRRKRLARVAATAYIHPRAEVARDLEAGEYSFIAPFCKVDPGVVLGRYSMLARRVAIVGDDHNWDIAGVPMQFSGRPPQTRTVIGDDVWVGYGALVRRGLTIGRGAIVAAGAIVTHDVAAYAVVAGVPARKIAERFPNPADREQHDAMLDGPLIAPRFTVKLSAPVTGVAQKGANR